MARDLHQQVATVRIATIAPLLEPLRQRVRTEVRTGSARDVRDATDALSKALLTLDPTAAPGGQRAMPLPPGSQGFVSWGPLAADDETSTKTPLAAGRRGHTVPGPGRSALTPGGPDLP